MFSMFNIILPHFAYKLIKEIKKIERWRTVKQEGYKAKILWKRIAKDFLYIRIQMKTFQFIKILIRFFIFCDIKMFVSFVFIIILDQIKYAIYHLIK